MCRIVFICLLVTASAPLLLHARREKKYLVKDGDTDTKCKYPPYVVALLMDSSYRVGTGTLISPVWVITVAHCLEDSVTQIQYGDMSEVPKMSEQVRLIEEKIEHPAYRNGKLLSNDIALCRVTAVPMETFGKLSAVDYRSLEGKAVKYAGYGLTEKDGKNDPAILPLQIGEGVVVTCKGITGSLGPNICVAPKCSNKHADSAPSDSGGPLFYDGKLVAVASGGDHVTPIGRYAAISPFITWIQDVMTTESERRKSKS